MSDGCAEKLAPDQIYLGFLIKLSRLIAGGWSRCSGAGLQDDVIFFFMA